MGSTVREAPQKIVTIVGARPQFIKAATVSRIFAARGVCEVLVHTGQHYDPDMSDVFFEQMGIPKPQYDLGIGGGRHGEMTGRQLEKLEEVLLVERPDWVLVYGDTNSTLAGALAAAKLHIRLAHVEAGLRSFNKRMPEEINRVVTDHVADILFAPTRIAKVNLINEGIPERAIHVVGDVMFDAARFYAERVQKPVWFEADPLLAAGFVLCTIHRAENTDDPARLRSIFEGLSMSTLPVVLPLHPRTRARLVELELRPPANVRVVDPVGYLEMVWLETHCLAVATDSGGVQKEAYFHRKPCVVLRDETEWTELVEAGCNVVVGVEPASISAALARPSESLDFSQDFYGSGDAAERVVEVLIASGNDCAAGAARGVG